MIPSVGEWEELIHDVIRATVYEGWRRMLTGYKNLDGTVTMAGAPVGKVWVRPPEDSRGGVAVWGSASIANAPVFVGPGIDGDLELKTPDWYEAVARIGEGTRVITLPPGMGELMPDSIPIKSMKVGRVELSPNGGLNIRVSAFAHTGGYWTSTADQDASAEEPGTTGYVCWVGAYLDPAANTVAFVSTTPVFGEPQDLTESGLSALVYPAGAVPLGPAFTLKNGQTQLSQSRFSDLDPRIFLRPWDNSGGGSGVNVTVRVVTTAGAITVTTDDYVVICNKTSGAATTVNLPASPSVGDAYVIKDGKGDAATNNLTLTPDSETIDGAADFVVSVNYASITLVFNGTEWNII